MTFLRFLACGLCLLMPPLLHAADMVTGTATYRERIAAPPDARFVAVLEDISRADAPAVELGRAEIDKAGNPPYAFEIAYDPAAIDDRHTYAVRATLTTGDRLLFTTDRVAQVLTRGAPSEIDLVMRMVSAAEAPAAREAPRIGAHGLRLPATFTGTLPCADCEGIAHHLDLWPDQTYHLRREWLGRDDDPGSHRRDELGRWSADPARGAIVLHGAAEMPIQWAVKGPERLRLLDMEGNPIESGLPYEVTSDGSLTETDLDGLFLGGMMTYMADAALFEECLTGRRYPIAPEGDYLALERAYLADRTAPGAPLYVHVEGGLLMRPAMEGPDRRSLVVHRFIKTRPDVTCERQQANAALTNTYWRIDRLGDEAVVGLPERREPHLILRAGDAHRFAATLGCNQMNGPYALADDGRLTFGLTASTMMACPPPLDALERTLAETLSAVRSYQISGETLVLYDEAGAVIALLTAVYLR